MKKDSMEFELIPQGISLKRIKKRALSYARQDETNKKRFRKTAIVPLAIAIFVVCFGAFAVTHDLWGLFFKNTELLEENNAVSMIGESKYAGDYKITLEEAAFSDSTGIIMLSLERIDGGELHPYFNLSVDFLSSGTMMGSQSSSLSEDRRKLTFCQKIDYQDNNIPETLTFNISAINSMPLVKNMADWPLSSIYSDEYGEIIAEKDISGLEELYAATPGYPIAGVELLDIFAAGHDGDRFVLAYKTESAKMDELKRTEFLWVLHDPRTDSNYWENSITHLPDGNDPEYIIYSYTGISEQDLDHLLPVVVCVLFEEPVQTDLDFTLSTRSGLKEAVYKAGTNPINETEGLTIESIKISPLGFTLTATSGEKLDISSAFAHKDTYCLMEDGTRIQVPSTSTSAVSDSTHRYIMEFTVDDKLLDAEKVKAIYINDQLFWSKQ